VSDAAPDLDLVFRRDAGRLVAWLARVFGAERLALAEDMVQDALIAALRSWRWSGVPDRPAAWLATVARNRAIDQLRREALGPAANGNETSASLPDEVLLPPPLADDTLRLMFVCGHPALGEAAQVALMLKTVCGFGVDEIAAAFLAKPAAIAQRLVRAKARIRALRLAFAIPDASEMPARLAPVLRSIYLLFDAGYRARGGDALVRDALCEEALRLVELLAAEPRCATPETRALAALIVFHHARRPARVDEDGMLLTLEQQDRSLWDRHLVARGFQHLAAAGQGDVLSAYHAEAGIAAAHVASPSFAATDWTAVVGWYDALAAIAPGPVVTVNRAVAVALRDGPGAGLAELRPLARDRRLMCYAPFHAALGELERRNGDAAAAAQAFRVALALPVNRPERRLIEQRQSACLLAAC
jgi:RNA polymerase sigma-70 factor (ECF subfamily)